MNFSFASGAAVRREPGSAGRVRAWLRGWAGLAGAWMLGGVLHAAPPVVTKVDPPSWWEGHSINPVRVLIRGQNLHGAQVSAPRGLKVMNATGNEAGTAVMVDLELGRDVRSGAQELELQTPEGAATVPFGVMDRLPRTGRFQGFGPDDVVYLVMPDRFANGDPANDRPAKSPGLLDRSKPRHYHGGDLKGLMDRLPYLRELGVTAVWINPWYDNYDHLNEREKYDDRNRPDTAKGDPVTDYHGYGAVDFYRVDEHLGDLVLLRELVDRAHALGLKVIQDQVANHTGPYHPWVADPPTPTWYHRTAGGGHLENPSQLWTLPDPYATAAGRRATLEGWFANLLPDLNQDDPEVARYLIQNALWWVGVTGVDGIRQDTLPYVPRTFWRDWSAALKREHPGLTLLGEMLDADITTVCFFQGGRARHDGVDSGIDALFDYPLYYRVREAFAEGKSLRPLAEQLARDHLWENPAQLLTFLGLHDVDRFMNGSGATADGLKLAFTFLFTTRGYPLIYAGDELGMRGGEDPDNRRDFPGGWSGDERNAFEASGRTEEENGIWNHVRKLAHLRRSCEALRRGRLRQLHVTDREYAYLRSGEKESVIVVLNNDPQPRTVSVPLEAAPAVLPDALGSGRQAILGQDGLRVELPGRGAAVFRRAHRGP